VTSSHDYIMFFSSRGRVYWLKAYKIPAAGRHAKGRPIVNLIEHLEEGEQIMDMIPVRSFDENKYLVFATKKGVIKKTKLSAYKNVRSSGIIAIKLDEDDELIDTRLTNGSMEIILATEKGMAIRFDEKDARPMGRATRGVRGIRLREDDTLVAMAAVSSGKSQLLTITERGYGKRTNVEEYRKTRRGGVGVITIKTGGRNGNVVMVREVSEDDELIVTSIQGMVIRIPVSEVRLVGRVTMGVRIMRIKEDDQVCAVARLVQEEDEERVISERRIHVSDESEANEVDNE
jgi:DNA gyrase subunit A